MELSEVHNILIKTATSNGWLVQPNQTKLRALMKSMAARNVNGTIVCPCKVYVEGMVELVKVRCPCPEAKQDIEEHGSCHCKAFIKVN